jgi:UDP-3-O-[3-hydroxymyristoyl] glucosamine N-acyltransferase
VEKILKENPKIKMMIIEPVIGAGGIIMEGTAIGTDCIIDPNVTIYDRCQIGNRVIINGGAVVGAGDLGFYQKDGVHVKIPQVGRISCHTSHKVEACHNSFILQNLLISVHFPP